MEKSNDVIKPNNKSILVVEDNIDIQESLKATLELEGFSVFTADNGKEAIEQLEIIPTPCLILLDLMMPVMNGWEFVEEINKDIMLSSIPIVVVTAIGDSNKSPKTDGYIPKPINYEALISAVCKHCGDNGNTSCANN